MAKRTHLDGWIDTNGEFFAVPVCGHYDFAVRVLGKNNGRAVDTLESQGWVHVSGKSVFVCSDFRATDAQYSTLAKLAEESEDTLADSLVRAMFK